MVSSNCGYPDPDNPSEDLSPNNEIIIATDTDTDDEENAYDNYEPLPTNEIGDLGSEEDDNSDTDNEQTASGNYNLPEITRMDEILVKEVWDGPVPKESDIPMDKNKVDQVKQAMRDFTLPSTSIPDWANNISEEEWEEQIITRLKNIQKNSDNL